jgi:hypothetical protein
LWPFSEFVNEASGPRWSSAEPFLDTGEDTLLSSLSSPPVTRPPPLRRVKPPAEAMRMSRCRTVDRSGELDEQVVVIGTRPSGVGGDASRSDLELNRNYREIKKTSMPIISLISWVGN